MLDRKRGLNSLTPSFSSSYSLSGVLLKTLPTEESCKSEWAALPMKCLPNTWQQTEYHLEVCCATAGAHTEHMKHLMWCSFQSASISPTHSVHKAVHIILLHICSKQEL
jgi:hypothetical protein